MPTHPPSPGRKLQGGGGLGRSREATLVPSCKGCLWAAGRGPRPARLLPPPRPPCREGSTTLRPRAGRRRAGRRGEAVASESLPANVTSQKPPRPPPPHPGLWGEPGTGQAPEARGAQKLPVQGGVRPTAWPQKRLSSPRPCPGPWEWSGPPAPMATPPPQPLPRPGQINIYLKKAKPPAAPGPGRAGGGSFRKYRFILFKRPWHRQGPQSPERGGERPQVSDFLSGRSPLTLALRVGDHMMFVQLQLAAQHAPLQHRHVLAAAAAAAAAARGDPSITTPVSSPCRPMSSTTRVSPVPTSPAPASPSPVTAGSFRSHAASTACPEQADCSPPASSGASTTSTPGGSPAPRTRKPGAVIESFVNHAPGVFSGTFSGTLHPNCQDSSGRPRRDIGTVLQILNDLLSATRQYQGMPPSLTQLRCHAQCAPTSPAPDLAPKSTSCEKLPAAPPASLLQGQSQIRMCKPPGDRLRQTENRATRCKVERLQLLLQQKRLRRKARRDARGPYHWPPSRKAGRSDSSSSGGGSSASEATGLGLDFEDSVWKPEVNPDIKSEFVVA
ncbi:midnolin isoform X1 [Tamandua tetradactyla]|uniref:midnolin isoform X1 n=1 Tax=Tamandua tetradactyla TaxID=48850 RepID=UPI004053F404